MTWSEWFFHFRQWLLGFPKKNMDSHLWISAAGEVEHDCWGCGAFAVEDDNGDLHRAPRPDSHPYPFEEKVDK